MGIMLFPLTDPISATTLSVLNLKKLFREVQFYPLIWWMVCSTWIPLHISKYSIKPSWFCLLSSVSIGLFCSTPAVAIARALPRKIAMQMLLTAEPITAQGNHLSRCIYQKWHAIMPRAWWHMNQSLFYLSISGADPAWNVTVALGVAPEIVLDHALKI